MNKVAITLPTRGRPERVIETVSKSCVNWRHPNTTLWIMADDDDVGTVVAVQNALPQWKARGCNVNMDVRKREDTIAEKWNRILKLEAADVYLTAADDDPHVTPGYDGLVLEAAARFPDGIGMVYGHMANASFSRVVAPTAKLVEKMGYIFPEYFPYWFVDHWTDDLAKLIGRISFADVTTDQTRPGLTQEFREPAWWATFFDAAYLMRQKQAADIIMGEDFQTPKWQKEILLRQSPLIHYRSRWINDSVRANAQQYQLAMGVRGVDDRYMRVKNRAIAMIPSLLDDYGMPQQAADWFRKNLLPQKILAPAQTFALPNKEVELTSALGNQAHLSTQAEQAKAKVAELSA